MNALLTRRIPLSLIALPLLAACGNDGSAEPDSRGSILDMARTDGGATDGAEPDVSTGDVGPGMPMRVSIEAPAEASLGEAVILDLTIDNRPQGCTPSVAWRGSDAPAPVLWEDSNSAPTQATFFAVGDYAIEVEVTCSGQSAIDAHDLAVTGEEDPDNAATFDERPRELHATIHSIGVEWDLAGDADHDAFGGIRVRREGTDRWLGSLPLIRIDYAFDPTLNGSDRPSSEPRDWNMLAGSALFLEAGATYDIDVIVADPDGGFAMVTERVTMRAEPVIPNGPRQYVVPGNGGGNGTTDDPFRGIDAADAVARPGDIFELAGGDYGGGTFDASGEQRAPIVWTVAEGAEVIFSSGRVGGDHIWLHGLHFVRSGESSALRPNRSGVGHVVVSRCRFDGFHYSITTNEGAHDWTIVDNTIVGDNDADLSDYSGEGVELSHTSGHVVAYNSISLVADGVSYTRRNCDVYGNDIWDTSDDGIEPDYGLANVRMWSNRIRDVHNNGLSFQPQRAGPWYFLFNQVVVDGLWVFKFNGLTDRSVMIHNTFVNLDDRIAQRASQLLSMWTRNNLFVSGSSRVIDGVPFSKGTHMPDDDFYAVDWRTDLDFDGFAWAHAEDTAPFRWMGANYESLDAWASDLGIEPRAVALELSDIGSLDRDVLTLPEGSRAIDSGVFLGPVHRHHAAVGLGPDLGAHEHGAPQTTYGPRP